MKYHRLTLRQSIRSMLTFAILTASVWLGPRTTAATIDTGGGFADHGVATAMSNHRGTVATVDGTDRNVVLVWLYDHRGGYALLCIDAATGASEEFATPFAWAGDCPFASLLSSHNRYYALFGGHFAEFDPTQRKFTFHQSTAAGTAMALTEDDAGRIWAATYPECGVVCFDPAARTLRDYGHVYKQNWPRYPRGIAVDDAGWAYIGVGNTASQILSLNPDTGEATPLLAEADRQRGMAIVHSATNGHVYGAPRVDSTTWLDLHHGTVHILSGRPDFRERPVITGDQNLTHRQFPDGKQLVSCDLVARSIVIHDPELNRESTISFDYHSDGALLMAVAAASDGTLCGGTTFPMRFFSFDPSTDTWANEPAYGQWNTITTQGGEFFVGSYPGGALLQWTPQEEWRQTTKGDSAGNPRFLTDCTPAIHRPHDLLASCDGRHVVMAGTPDYGYTGGGLLLWDRSTGERTLLEHTQLLRDQSTMSLAELASGKIVAGTTTDAGTGGERLAEQAELYIYDPAAKVLEWHETLLPGARSYLDLCAVSTGYIYGIVDHKLYFVFDPATRKVIHQQSLGAELGVTTGNQGPRVLIPGNNGVVYLLLANGIAEIDPTSFEIRLLGTSPQPITAGGDLLGGRIYFACQSHLCSFTIPQSAPPTPSAATTNDLQSQSPADP